MDLTRDLAVVIPTLNEAPTLPFLLADLRAAGIEGVEIIVSDGGSTDETVEIAIRAGATVVSGPRGRAKQLNAGALRTTAEWLLFVHADSRIPEQTRLTLREATRGLGGSPAAVFRFAIDLPPFWKAFIECGQRLRERLWGLPYGDQGLLVSRSLFEAIGGYPDMPLMEDVAIIRRIRVRTRLARLPTPIVTSGRRYRERGVLRTWLAHTALIVLYATGVSPARLARWRTT